MARLDPQEGFDVLKERVTEAISSNFPQEGSKHILELEGVNIQDDLDMNDLEAQKKAKLRGTTFGVPVKATMVLKDKETGDVLERKTLKVATLPKYTRRHSFIVKGSEYQVDSQWRLKPGIYTRVAQNGELQSRFNFQGKQALDMTFDPKSKVFRMKHGGSKPPLYPVLKAAGVDDDTLQAAWGKDILNANKTTPNGKPINVEKLSVNFAKRLDPRADVKDMNSASDVIRAYLEDAELRKDVTELTLGKAFDKITPEVLTRSSKRLLGVARGDEKPDTRDALMFKDLLSTEDFIAERMGEGTKVIQRRINNNLDRRSTIREIVGPDVFDRPIREFFSKSSLANTPQQTNPLEMLSGQQRTTITGEGGVKDAHKIMEDAKLVDPSHFGILDALHTPESEKTGVSLHLSTSAVKKGKTVVLPLINVKTGKTELLDPRQINENVIAMPDEGEWKNGKWVPKSSIVKASVTGNEIREVKAKDVKYVMGNAGQMFSVATNMVPFLNSDSPNRSTMAGRHMEQAIPLKNPEAPLVQSDRGDGRSYDEFVGRYASHESPIAGKITKIEPGTIHIKAPDGTAQKVQIYNNYPLNDKKGVLHSKPVVEVGQEVKPGQLLADSNYTKNGVYAPGINMRVGYTPWKGYNFEDGVVISDTAAQKLTSEHMYKKSLSTREAQVVGLKRFMANKSTALSKEQVEKLGDDGIIKPGMKVHRGDTLIAALSEKAPTTEAQMLKNLHRSLANPFDNRSVTWDEDVEGEVVEVNKKGKNIQVHVRTAESMQVGDKIAGRHGNKGIVTRILPDHEMPQTADGKPLEVVMNPIGIAGRMNVGQVLETAAGKLAEKTGAPFKVQNFGQEDNRTKVEKELKKAGISDKETIIDPIHNKEIPGVLVGNQYILKLQHQVDKKMMSRSRDGYDRNLVPKGGGQHGAQALGALGIYAMLAHGAKCLMGGTTLRTKDGGRVEISDVVKNRKTVEILCADPETKELDYKPVVAWSVRVAEPEELCCVSVAASNPSGRKHLYKLKCTENHTIYTDRGKVQAGDLEEGDWLLTPGVRLHPFQRQMILGSVLGDGSLSRSDTFASSYRVTHGEAQREYCDWKREICSGITRAGKLSVVTKGRGDYSDGPKFRFWTKSVGELSELRRVFYPEGKKIIPQEVLDELDEVGLAFWFMDDGSTDIQEGRPQKYRTVRLAVCDFDDDSVDRAQKWFERRWGLHSTVQRKSGKYPYLHFFNENATEFLKIVAPYIHETMQYKLRLNVDHHGFSNSDLRSVGSLCSSLLVQAVEGLEKVAVLSVDPYEPKYYEDYLVYNVEVEDHHNYVADGVLVGNSNIREMQTMKCFTWNTPVITEDGVMPIGKIVNQRLDVKVLSYNTKTRQLEYKPVLNFWKRGMDDTPLVELTVHSPAPSGVFKRRRIRCTHEHEIYDETGAKVFARDMGGRRALVPALSLTPIQQSVLVGSLLGDGCLQIHRGPFPAFQERHCIAQEEYLQFKAELLGGFSRRQVRRYNAGEEGFNVGQEMCEWATLAQPAFSYLWELFYISGRKIIPYEISEMLDPLSIAVWYQDDGSLVQGNRQRILRIHVGVLDTEDRSILISALKEKVGVNFTETRHEVQYKDRPSVQWSLRLGKNEEIDRFLEYVRPFVHPSMSYKVGGGVCGQSLIDLRGTEQTELFAVEIESVRPFRPNVWEGRFLYNLEVEGNHNYFAGGLLVGNSDKAQADEVWAALQAGEPIPPPQTTFAYKKFEGYLKGMGINVEKDGNSLNLMPLTDQQVLDMSNGQLKDAGRAVRGYKIGSKRTGNIEPEKSGLFDTKVTGGLDGMKWSHITLNEPIPNPVFEKAVKSVAGVRGPQFDRIISGENGVDAKGNIVPTGVKGATYGPQAIGVMLDKVDVQGELKKLEAKLPSMKEGQPLNEARRKIKYLRALNKLNMSPRDAYMMQHVPVMPPAMRPLSTTSDGNLQFDDLNQLYKDVALLDQQLREQPSYSPESIKAEPRADVYDRMKALTGMGGTLQNRYKGIANIISGDSPKLGYAQDKLIKRKQDLTMRSTIVPEPSLSLDDIAIPRKAATELYKPFIVREMRMSTGMGPLTAKQMIENDPDHEMVRTSLRRVVEDRPLLVKRDPALHKYNIQAFKPKIVEGKAIQIHPLVCSGYNADFDGDTMSAYVPLTNEAVDEARKMFPSRILFNPATAKVMYTPSHEAQVGLFMKSEVGKSTRLSFKSKDELQAAVRAGKLGSNDAATVGNVKTTLDRMELDSALPKDLQGGKLLTDLNYRFTKGEQNKIFGDMAHADKNGYAQNIDRMKDMGNLKATHSGFSFGLEDFEVKKGIRDPLLRDAARKTAKLNLDKDKDMEKFVDVYEDAMKKMQAKLKAQAQAGTKPLDKLEVAAGIKGKGYAQLTGAPVLFVDAKGDVVPSPVKKSYSEGLNAADYWASASGGRKGVIQKVQSVSEPGYLTKLMMNSTMNTLVSEEDCGTGKGISLSIDEPDIIGRFTTSEIKAGKTTIPTNMMLTPEVLNKIRNAKVSRVLVRSPMRCDHSKGVCKKSMHPGTMVSVCRGDVRPRGAPLSISLRDLFDLVDEPVQELDSIQVKSGDGWYVWDDGWTRLKRVLRHPREPEKEILEIKTTTGHVQHLTEDHTCVIYRPLISCPLCRSQHLSVGKVENEKVRVSCSCGKNFSVSKDVWDGAVVRLEIRGDAVLPGDRIKNSHCVLDTADHPDIDPYFLGCYLAEGSTNRKSRYPRTVTIAQADGPCKSRMVEACRKVTTNDVHVRDDRIDVHDTKLVKELSSLFGGLDVAHEKRLPSNWLGWDLSYQKALVGGLIDGDGSVKDRKGGEVIIGSSSYTLLLQVQTWLRVLGIRGSVSYASCSNKPSHGVQSRAEHFHLRFPAHRKLAGIPSVKIEGLPELGTENRWDPGQGFGTVTSCRVVSAKADFEWVYDVTTSSSTFVANGMQTHNCMGLNENGQLHDLGTNVGVMSAQAIGERGTQLAMRSFHSGGVFEGRAAQETSIAGGGLDRAMTILHMPKKVKGSAKLAEVNGSVSAIKKDPAGGVNITIGNTTHYVPADRKVLTNISKGTSVKKGDPITAGPINPHELLPLTNMNKVQGYLASELHSIYAPEGIRRRNSEVVVRSLSNVTKIEDPGDNEDFIIGDFAPTLSVNEWNKQNRRAGKLPIRHTPVLKGVKQIPLDVQTDWLARLNHENLRGTIIDAAQQGWASQLHGDHPIPPLIYGSEFGRGTKEKPWAY